MEGAPPYHKEHTMSTIHKAMREVAEQLIPLENLVPLLKEASTQMGVMRRKMKFMEAGQSDIMEPEFPRKLAPIIPLLNHYYEDRKGWYEFIRYLRDNGPWPEDSAKWKKIQDQMRAEQSNALQNRNRTHSGQMADLREASEGKLKRGERGRYMTAIQKYWTAQLSQRKANAWAASGKNHLSVDERAEITFQFWKEIEEQINAGNYPDPASLVMDQP